MSYDSRPDTYEHIGVVREVMVVASGNLAERGLRHDASKLVEPELSAFDRATERLKDLEYGTDEYWESLTDLEECLAHHYAHNSHHPQHFKNGIRGMSLLDLTEMLIDWHAATKRTKDGDLIESIRINQERFGYTSELADILINTAKELGLVT